MNFALLGLWVLVGWCGTWPRPWPPPPPPDGWWLKVTNIVGAVIGGWAFTQIWPTGDPVTGIAAAATSVGAFVGANVLGDVYNLAMSRQKG